MVAPRCELRLDPLSCRKLPESAPFNLGCDSLLQPLQPGAIGNLRVSQPMKDGQQAVVQHVGKGNVWEASPAFGDSGNDDVYCRPRSRFGIAVGNLLRGRWLTGVEKSFEALVRSLPKLLAQPLRDPLVRWPVLTDVLKPVQIRSRGGD